jgi:serine protease Do
MRLNRFYTALAAAGVLGMGAASAAMQAQDAPVATPATAASTAAVTSSNRPDFERIVAEQGPSVVNISVVGSRESADEVAEAPFGGNPFGRGNPFGEEFPFEFGPRGHGGPQMPARGMGSGFILSEDGLVVTNAHVVKGAGEVTVKLTDRREFRAKVLGADPRTDVAILKIDAKNLPAVTLGDVTDLDVGEWVLAIGSPFGFENSATVGVVSAKKRAIPGAGYVPFIQTDVAVNPGNSGGPLFNSKGEVVGINSQIYSRTGGYQGLSFAIPIDLAMRVKDQIVATGNVQHGRLGVGIQEVDQALADAFGLDTPAGAAITSVADGGPAQSAGLQTGDVVRKVNDTPVVTAGDLAAIVGMLPPGEKVTLEVWRDGKVSQISATLAAMDKVADAGSRDKGAETGPRLGLTVGPRQPGTGTGASSKEGVLVHESTGAAAAAGVRPGDVLIAVDGSKVKSAQDVKDALKEAGKSVALLVQRGEARIFVPVPLG